jgi:hypothetical protein
VADERLRALERAAQDDPSRGAELLVARMRRGDLDRSRVELAAFLGAEDAQRAMGAGRCEGCHTSWWPRLPEAARVCPCCDLRRWALKLCDRAPYAVGVRAAYVACDTALVEWLGDRGWWLCGRERGDVDGQGLAHVSNREQPEEFWRPVQRVLTAMDAVASWLDHGGPRVVPRDHMTDGSPLWLWRLLQAADDAGGRWPHNAAHPAADAIVEADREVSFAAPADTVRKNVTTQLLAWALSSERTS